ncbi:hypothetical protein GRI39_05845 [Altererythrobacter indicus]|uniref:Uncharacterized protein n=1 Tax=Altericroceibacterium indicum TaxID=374177 RepID=A0A845A7A8_9SPHN|nr:hypothetical protein [Altericroceibacterium indicum]MXP25564.1 hypothetical protein [Altericroceibacterium indicum]
MRKSLFAAPLALAAALALTTPAMAAPARYNDSGITSQITQLDWQINRAEQRRIISNREAQSYHRELNQVQKLNRQLSRNGLSGNEAKLLDNKLQRIKGKLIKDQRYAMRQHEKRTSYRR